VPTHDLEHADKDAVMANASAIRKPARGWGGATASLYRRPQLLAYQWRPLSKVELTGPSPRGSAQVTERSVSPQYRISSGRAVRFRRVWGHVPGEHEPPNGSATRNRLRRYVAAGCGAETGRAKRWTNSRSAHSCCS